MSYSLGIIFYFRFTDNKSKVHYRVSHYKIKHGEYNTTLDKNKYNLIYTITLTRSYICLYASYICLYVYMSQVCIIQNFV